MSRCTICVQRDSWAKPNWRCNVKGCSNGMHFDDRVKKTLCKIEDKILRHENGKPVAMQCLKMAIESLFSIFRDSNCDNDGMGCRSDDIARDALVKILDQWEARI